jgi:hypothetical protein
MALILKGREESGGDIQNEEYMLIVAMTFTNVCKTVWLNVLLLHGPNRASKH